MRKYKYKFSVILNKKEIMIFLQKILILIYFLLSTNLIYAKDTTHVIYQKPKSSNEIVLKTKLEKLDSIKNVSLFINEYFNLPKKLVFVFGANDGPLYDSQINQILIPYSFVEEIKIRFQKAKYHETGVSVDDATNDALIHTMFHEFAHAIIFLYDLPVLGKEEDAADALSTIILSEFFEDGQEIAISAADLFNLESDDIDIFEKEDFWDEHSLDIQRYYTTLCHIYGSDPEKYRFIIEEEGLEEERAALCIDEYQQNSQSWLTVLEPYMKKK